LGDIVVKQSRYMPELVQRVDRVIALPFRDLGARRGGWSAPRPGRFTPGKDPVPVVGRVVNLIILLLVLMGFD
jgi:hypothetical protein